MPKRKRRNGNGGEGGKVKQAHLAPNSNNVRRSLRLLQRYKGTHRIQLPSPVSSIARVGDYKRKFIAEDSLSGEATQNTKKRRKQYTTATNTVPEYEDWVTYWVFENATLPPTDFFAARPMASNNSMKRPSTPSRSQSTQERFARLKEHGVIMDDTRRMTVQGRELCNKLLAGDRPPAGYPVYGAEHWRTVLQRAASASEAIIQRDILPTIVPSIDNLNLLRPKFLEGIDLDPFGDEINAEWTRVLTMGGKHPKPDYVAGLRQSAFNSKTWEVLEKYATPDAPVLLSPDMCFPLVLAEAKRGTVGIQEAMFQVTQAAAIAVKSQILLHWKAYGKSHPKVVELYGHPLVFSVCHNHDEVHILAHYALLETEGLKFYFTKLSLLSLSMNDGQAQNVPNTFFGNVYKECVPVHLKRLRETAEALRVKDQKERENEKVQSYASTGISFSTSQIELDENNDDPQISQDSEFKQPDPPKRREDQSKLRERALQKQIDDLKKLLARRKA